ncbi:hypothetical protein BGW38_003542 [Lunasporangiospora selenospora]|uniref:Uncharacterized protein n=1 Tax=Lunasporangiospora selenospora TaxID=979761 RepID=A0A9P6FSJ3_9FUNG|nr:hypothetical protein BGW38_003542 [Lunasporangiospora selenospora]
MHREDLSSAPSSPRSPHRDDFQDDYNTNESAASTPQWGQYYHHSNASAPMSSMSGSGGMGAGAGMVSGASMPIPSTNLPRRISIAELCNPMQSLATEHEWDDEEEGQDAGGR